MLMLLEVGGTVDRHLATGSLARLLRSDGELRSVQIKELTHSAQPSEMSAVTDGLLVVFGTGGVGVAIVQAISGWMTSRQSEVTVKMTSGDRGFEYHVKSKQTPREIIEVLGLTGSVDEEADG